MAGQSLGINGGTRMDPQGVLDELRRLTLEQFGSLPASLYRAVEQALQASPAGLAFEDQAILSVLRMQSASHVMRFRQEIARGFDAFREPPPRAGGGELNLIAEGVIDLHLAGQRLAEALDHRYQRPLEVMKQRMGALAAAMNLTSVRNPVSPTRLASAMVETLADAGLTESLAGHLFRQYQLELGRVLDDLYVRINALLATAGYGGDGASRRSVPMPSTRPWARPDEFAPAREPAPPGAQAGGLPASGMPAPATASASTASAPQPASPAQAGFAQAGADLSGSGMPHVAPRLSAELAGLRAQLHAWRSGEQRPAAGNIRPVGPGRELRLQEVFTIASIVQGDPPDSYARALASSGRLGDAIRDHLVEGARRLGLSSEQARLGESEQDAVDLVAMLFESLFRTHALQDRARRLYARLVMPYVKVALASDAMFVQAQHPARRLLDAVTEACEDNTGATPQDRELLERAAAVSQRVVAEFNEDLAVFELAHAELEALLVQQRRRTEVQEGRASKATFGRERLAQARLQADQILQRRLLPQPLTAAVAEFLASPWRHHLVQTVLREGGESLRMADAVQLGDALVAADMLAAQPGRGGELADALLALEPAIVDCLGSSGLDQGAARHGMAMVVRDLACPDTARRVFDDVAPLSGDDPTGDDPRLALVGGTSSLPHDPGVAAMIRRLQPGEWLRVLDAQGEATAVKIAWVSPLTSRLLLVNRRGMRVLVAAPEELAVMVGEGRLILGSERTPFAQAMQVMQQRLDHAVGHR